MAICAEMDYIISRTEVLTNSKIIQGAVLKIQKPSIKGNYLTVRGK